MRGIFIVMIVLINQLPACAQNSAAAGKDKRPPSILFIAIDDLNDWIGCLDGHPQAKTPFMDRLAARGTLFSNAHCQAPLCNPSRSSLLTGLRPSTTGIYTLKPGVREVERTRDVVTLPQFLAGLGYWTATFGKIFHDGSIAVKARDKEFDVWGAAPGMPKPPRPFVETPGKHPAMDWGIFPEDDRDQADWKIADAAIAGLKARPRDRPFFLAAGFRLPHVPCYASKKWFDLHPDATLQLPEVKEDDRSDTPEFSWYLHWKLPEPRLSWLKKAEQWRPLVRSYLASISFVDSQVGRLLKALEDEGLADNTIVILWSDHGWHLGEKGITGKNSLWRESTRVPLIFAGPGIARNAACKQPAELLDLYPTLVEMCGSPIRKDLEGHSLLPQLKDAKTPRPWPALTTHNQGNHAVRSERWRYIRYADGSEELYDCDNDPREWKNLARDARFAEVIRDHARWLPVVNASPAPGSAARLLVHENGAWLWEGKAIIATEKEN